MWIAYHRARRRWAGLLADAVMTLGVIVSAGADFCLAVGAREVFILALECVAKAD